MRTANHIQSSHLSLVKPPHVHRTVEANHFPSHSSRVLELSSILQTTLKTHLLIELFSRKVSKYIKLDGVRFRYADSEETIETGVLSQHRATYDLRLESRMLGTLCFYRGRTLNKKDISLLENLLCALVYPLRNALDYNHALEMASHDALTGAQNRHAMDSALQREINLAKREGTPLSMLVLDADHFKRFNDTYGHAYGDAVLKTITETI